jgi:hypothetical protein
MTPSNPAGPACARRHKEMLVLAGLVVTFAFLLEVQDGRRVALWLLPSYPLPESCPSHTILGVDCPGCGLTRSIVYLAHGEWTNSWKMHRIGWLLAATIVLQFPYRIVSLRRGHPVLGRRFPMLLGYTLIFLLLANWLFNVVGRAYGWEVTF